MTDFDVEQDMTRTSMINDKIESLLRGTSPDANDPLATELAFIRQSISAAFPLPVVSEQIEDAHLARMMAARVPAAAFVAADVAADRTGPMGMLKASLGRRIGAVTLAVSTAFGGAAYAGVLPDSVQRAVADAASVVGLDLPGGEDDALAGNEADDGPLDIEPADADGGVSSDGENSEQDDNLSGASTDDDEDRQDDDRDANEDDQDDAEDRRDDEADQREDDADDGRDAEEDEADEAEDEADDRRDEAEDDRDDETDDRDDDANDELDETEDDARDEAEESREELGDESRGDLDEPDDLAGVEEAEDGPEDDV